MRCDGPASPAPRAAEPFFPEPRGPAAPGRPSWTARALLAAVRGYQLLLSPILGGSCRYVPSCSQYMAEAVRRHGAASGAWLGFRRLSRCHPFGSSGLDPVPDEWPPLPKACCPGHDLPGALLGSGDAPSPSPAWPGGRPL